MNHIYMIMIGVVAGLATVSLKDHNRLPQIEPKSEFSFVMPKFEHLK